MTDERRPTGFANYRGDHRQILDRGDTAMGPNLMGELLWPVTADYDPETNRTRVGFSLLPPGGVR